MSESITALASENLNPSLRSLLEDVQRGHIRVPRFQRPFVWKDEQRLQLLESIRDNMPIGSLLVWTTKTSDLKSFPAIGPHAIPAPADVSTIRGSQYLLDGHQRVATLLSVLLKPSNPNDVVQMDDEDSIDWDIQYDLMEQEFVFAIKIKKASEKRPLLPLWTLLDGRLINKHMREMRGQAKANDWADPQLADWEERADQLTYRFQQCRIPIVVMMTDDLNLAARAFQRINSLGTPMGEAHLIAALTWTAEFDLREKLAALREDLPHGWQEIEERIFLQVCKGLISDDFSVVSEKALVEAIKTNRDILNQAAIGIQKAIALLTSKGRVVRQDLLPYLPQLVFLAIEFAERNVDQIPEQAFMTWFWRTGWTEAFGNASFRKVRAEQVILQKLTVMENAGTWPEKMEISLRFDPRFARIRLLMLRIATQVTMVDEDNHPIDTETLLETYGKDAFVRLLPTPSDASPKLRKLLQSFGNRYFIEPAKTKTLRRYLMESTNPSPIFLTSHFISQIALQLFRADQLERFIELRNKEITEWYFREWDQEKQIFDRTRTENVEPNNLP